MATRQEQLDPEADQQVSVSEGVATDFPKVKTPDQSDIPHHAAADPTQPTPKHPSEGAESETE
jgi:hypothetical protein